jgi:hypothetical protein
MESFTSEETAKLLVDFSEHMNTNYDFALSLLCFDFMRLLPLKLAAREPEELPLFELAVAINASKDKHPRMVRGLMLILSNRMMQDKLYDEDWKDIGFAELS